MTREQLNAIRARVAFAHAEFNSPHDSVCGDLYVQDTTRLLAEVERLTAERDDAKAKVHEAFGDAFSAMSEKLRYSSDAYIERITKAAFKRGVAAMREAAVEACRPEYPDAVRRLRALPDLEDK